MYLNPANGQQALANDQPILGRSGPNGASVQEGELLKAVNLFKAFNNPARLLVLCLLIDGRKSVGELQRLTGASQSMMSQHLRLLRQLGLVKCQRQAQTIYYSLSGDDAPELVETICRLCPSLADCRREAKQEAA